MEDEDPLTRPLALAISGGGHRATLYALGSFMALVDRGLNREIVQISSVSGGSILNGCLAHCGQDINELSPEEFDEIARGIVDVVVRRGVLGPFWIGALLSASVATAVVVAILCWLASVPTWLIWLPVLLAFAGPLLGGGRLLGWRLGAIYFRNRARRNLADLRSQVEHVFCATDLGSGYPVYFSTASPGRMWMRTFMTELQPGYTAGFLFDASGWALSDIVRASAGFPGIPPLVLRLTGMKLLQQPDPFPPPRRPLYLSDGGIVNNLATQTLREDSLVKGAGMYLETPQILLCINASAPMSERSGWPFFLPGIAQVTQLWRCLQILGFNSVTPRISCMRESLVHRARSGAFNENVDLAINLLESPEDFTWPLTWGIGFERKELRRMNKSYREWQDFLGRLSGDWVQEKTHPAEPSDCIEFAQAVELLGEFHKPDLDAPYASGLVDRASLRDLEKTSFWRRLLKVEAHLEEKAGARRKNRNVRTTLGRIDVDTAHWLLLRAYAQTFLMSLSIRAFEPSKPASPDRALAEDDRGLHDPTERILRLG